MERMSDRQYSALLGVKQRLIAIAGAGLLAGSIALSALAAKAHEAVIPMLEKQGTLAEVSDWLSDQLVRSAQAAQNEGFQGPTKPKGIGVQDLGKFDLGKELQGMEGRLVRARLWNMEPGGIVPVHSHENRPAQIYVLTGEVVEYRSDSDQPHVYRAGDLSLEAEGVVHWWENTSDVTVYLLAVDVFNAGKN